MTESERIVLAAIGDVFRVDDEGRIWRIASGRRAENGTGEDRGYLQVRLMVDGRRHHVMAHRIVWMHRHGPLADELEVNHENGVRDDNHPGNLRPCTGSENCTHSRRVLGNGDQRGERNHQTRLSDEAVALIRTRRAAGERQADIADDFGVTHQTVSKIIRGDRRQSAAGTTNRIDGRSLLALAPTVEAPKVEEAAAAAAPQPPAEPEPTRCGECGEPIETTAAETRGEVVLHPGCVRAYELGLLEERGEDLEDEDRGVAVVRAPVLEA